VIPSPPRQGWQKRLEIIDGCGWHSSGQISGEKPLQKGRLWLYHRHSKLNSKKEGMKMALTDVKEVFSKMPEVFNPSAAQGLDVVIQYNITGEGGGNWNITIKDGACQIQEGSHDSPTVTLTMSSETWLSMVNKEINGMQAFMSGQLKVSGDMMLAQRIEQLFPL